MPMIKEEATSTHHLSAMPVPLHPPLSLRTPCPEGIRQRPPEGKGYATTSVRSGLGGDSLLYLLVTPRGFLGGHAHQP